MDSSISVHFDLLETSSDLLLYKDDEGVPYAVRKYLAIIKDRYLISKHSSTSYVDVGDMTPSEREAFIRCLLEDVELLRLAIEEGVQELGMPMKEGELIGYDG